ncbi:hypothetical protein D9M68_947400 [compost metagenome]
MQYRVALYLVATGVGQVAAVGGGLLRIVRRPLSAAAELFAALLGDHAEHAVRPVLDEAFQLHAHRMDDAAVVVELFPGQDVPAALDICCVHRATPESW